MVLVFFVTAPFVDLDAIAARISEVCASSTKPMVMVVETSETWYHLIDNLRKGGVPVYEFAEDGVRALAAMTRYQQLKSRLKEPLPEISADRSVAKGILDRYEGKDLYLPQV